MLQEPLDNQPPFGDEQPGALERARIADVPVESQGWIAGVSEVSKHSSNAAPSTEH